MVDAWIGAQAYRLYTLGHGQPARRGRQARRGVERQQAVLVRAGRRAARDRARPARRGRRAGRGVAVRATCSPWPGRSTRARTRSSATSSPSGCSACRGVSDEVHAEHRAAGAGRERARVAVRRGRAGRGPCVGRRRPRDPAWSCCSGWPRSASAELADFPVELVVVFEELGRHAVPGPLIESYAVAPALGLTAELATVALPPHVPYALDADVATPFVVVRRRRVPGRGRRPAHVGRPGAAAVRGPTRRVGRQRRGRARPRRALPGRPAGRPRARAAGAGGGVRDAAEAVRPAGRRVPGGQAPPGERAGGAGVRPPARARGRGHRRRTGRLGGQGRRRGRRLPGRPGRAAGPRRGRVHRRSTTCRCGCSRSARCGRRGARRPGTGAGCWTPSLRVGVDEQLAVDPGHPDVLVLGAAARPPWCR